MLRTVQLVELVNYVAAGKKATLSQLFPTVDQNGDG